MTLKFTRQRLAPAGTKNRVRRATFEDGSDICFICGKKITGFRVHWDSYKGEDYPTSLSGASRVHFSNAQKGHHY
jgi:hypothetical protein